jgi:hypothetical protein
MHRITFVQTNNETSNPFSVSRAYRRYTWLYSSRILPFTIASGDVSTTQPLNEARILRIDEFKFSIEPAKKFHPEMDILVSKVLGDLSCSQDAIIVLGSS